MSESASSEFLALGQKITSVDRLDVFPAPEGVEQVELVVKEFTSVCPVTGQPDYSEIEIVYTPDRWCIESKSLKLFLWQYRNRGVFCEALSAELARTIRDQIDAVSVEVTVHQAARGGIEIHSTSSCFRE